MRGEMPMDVEHELGWRCSGKQRQVRCTHLSPLKKRKMEPSHEEEGHTQMVKYPSDALGLATKKARRPSVVNIARVPVVLIGYLHLLLNSVVIGFICYVVVYVLVGLQRDIGYKMISRRAQIQHQIEEAKTSYRINKCDPATRVPAIEELCSKWECVIKNGYRSMGYTRIIAEVFGDVMDGFVRKFSVRSSLTIGFFFVLFLVFRRAAKA